MLRCVVTELLTHLSLNVSVLVLQDVIFRNVSTAGFYSRWQVRMPDWASFTKRQAAALLLQHLCGMLATSHSLMLTLLFCCITLLACYRNAQMTCLGEEG